MIPEEYFYYHDYDYEVSDGSPTQSWISVPVFFPYKKIFEPNEIYSNDEIAESIAYYYRIKKTRIAFLSISEGFIEKYIINMYTIINKLISKHNIPIDEFIYISGALPIKQNIKYFHAICDTLGVPKIKLVLSNLLEASIPKDINTDSEIKIKKKKFVSMNGTARKHRVFFTMLLIEKKLLDFGYYSFGLSKGQDKVSNNFEGKLAFYNTMFIDFCMPNIFARIKNTFLENCHKFPMRLTVDTVSGKYSPSHFVKEDLEIFRESYFNIVQETTYHNHDHYSNIGDMIFISEKTYRSMLYKVPFVILSRPYSLKGIRDHGYLTFSPYINEEYDNIEDPELRMLAILEEVERLCNLTDNDWLTIQRELQSVIEYNYNKLKNSNFNYIVGNIDGTISQLT